ncbi:unnamed protein product [Strongylus vulgaris]|uniref:Uncharacterized protein n=1 Tax=Strongylus vulgaris TaxID=40348 RepID=A0A3P7JNT0_STRVU|nr:unnamed protein product [Strongylus vulgaris]
MGELETERDALEHFVASGRAGRRNALPEIEVSHGYSSLFFLSYSFRFLDLLCYMSQILMLQ